MDVLYLTIGRKVVSGSDKCFLMKKGLFAISLQNILYEKKVTEFFYSISYVISAVYKDNKETNGKSSDYNFGVGDRQMLKPSLHDAWFILAANITSQSYRWWCYENPHALREVLRDSEVK